MISPESLRRHHCFAPIAEQSLKALAMIANERSVPAGAVLFREGDRADALSIILEGRVDIQYTLREGDLRTVDTLVEGDLLGWSALVEPYRMTGVAKTCSNTRLIDVDAKGLRVLCERDPLLGYRLLTQVVRLLADRLDGARVQLAAVG
jgi:CRP-like cAMP-binding protein